MSTLKLITNKDKLLLGNPHSLMLFYQTCIRNVAGTTALSIAALGYSRFYKGKNKSYVSIIMVIVSLLILSSSILFNLFLYYDVQKYIRNPKYKQFNKWLIINILFMFIHFFILFFIIYTFYRVFTGNTF